MKGGSSSGQLRHFVEGLQQPGSRESVSGSYGKGGTMLVAWEWPVLLMRSANAIDYCLIDIYPWDA
jgi:hypothetical protein